MRQQGPKAAHSSTAHLSGHGRLGVLSCLQAVCCELAALQLARLWQRDASSCLPLNLRLFDAALAMWNIRVAREVVEYDKVRGRALVLTRQQQSVLR